MFNGKRLSGWMALAVFAVGGSMVATDPAFAKVDVDKLTISGEARIRYEIRTNAAFGNGTIRNARPDPANESAASHRIRIGVGYDLTPDVSFFAQIQDARVWGSECNAAACGAATTGIGTVSSANNNGTGVDLHQGYILVKNLFVSGLSLKAGRQEIIYGDHRLFGNFGWSQVGNSFDAVKLSHSSQMADVDVFWARLADGGDTGAAGTAGGFANHGVIFPANGARGTSDANIYGAYVTLKPIANWTIEPYLFVLKDDRTVGIGLPATAGNIGALNTPQAADQLRNTAGLRINGKAGGLDATVEGVWQTGSINSRLNGVASSNTDRDLRINAIAGAAKAGYTMAAVPMKPRIGIEFDYASGDGKANATTQAGHNGHFNTFDNLYPTNHFHYGYMDLMAWRNMVNYQIMFDVKPSDVSKLQANFIIHRLADAQDNWYRAGQGVYATSCLKGTAGCAGNNDSASLGRELDIHYWHTLKEKFKFEVGFGHFWAGEYITKGHLSHSTLNGSGAGVGAFSAGQNWGYVMGSVLF